MDVENAEGLPELSSVRIAILAEQDAADLKSRGCVARERLSTAQPCFIKPDQRIASATS